MTERRPGLDLLRACAITFVVLAHGLTFLYPHVPWLGYLGHLGSYGVDLFFVLSGYLIGGILLRHGDKLKSPPVLVGFWLRRWLRTLPNYFLFLAVNLIVVIFIYRRAADWRGEVLPSAVFLQSVTKPPGGFFTESWTLAIEEWFYLLFPLALCLGYRAGGRWPRVVWLVLLAMMMAGPIVMRLLLKDGTDWGAAVRMPVVQRLDSIAFGVGAATVAAWCPGWWKRGHARLAMAGVTLLVPCYVMLFLVDVNHSWFARTLWFDVVAMGFMLLLPWADQATRLPAARMVGAVARWSYSMYLTNFLLLGLGLHWFGPRAQISAAAAWAVFAGYWVCCLALSAAVYRWYERPVMDLRERFPVANRTVASGQHPKLQAAGAER